MVNRRLRSALEGEGRLDHRQHAFRAGHGTSTYFASLGEVIKGAHAKGHHVELVSLDISKAFNRTWTPFVLQELVKWGFRGNVLTFIQRFLTNRSFRVAVGNTKSSTFQEETGVPQGSVIAVTLFLIAMNRVFERLPANIYLFVYADDVLIVTTGRTTVRTRNQAQAAVTAVVRWASSAGFQLSATKSVRCHTCNSGHRVRGPPIKIGDQPIPTKNTVCILGVIIDRKLSFVQHFNNVKANCKTRLNLIRTISRPHRSNNRAIRMYVARAIIDSRLLYGLELTAMAMDRMQQVLAPTYNCYVRVVSGLLPSTPADSACAEVGILPFRQRINVAVATKAAAFLAKTSGSQRIYLLDEVNRILRTIANRVLPPVAKSHWLGSKSWQSASINIDNRIKDNFRAGDNSEALRRSVAEMVSSGYPEYTHRYTDGSKTRVGVGIGITGDISPTSLSLPPQCSVFSAEAAAAYVAATAPSERPILIVTDSHSVISELQSETPTHPWVQGIIKHAPPNAVFAWVPGHCGIPGNVHADRLAGAGPSEPRHTNKVPLPDVKKWIASTVQAKWQAEWIADRGHFLRRIKESTGPWIDLRNLREQRVISRLRTGHTRISHNFSGGAFRKTCETCNIPASVEHILCVCPKFELLRQRHDIPGNVSAALKNDPTILASLISFLKDAGLFYEV